MDNFKEDTLKNVEHFLDDCMEGVKYILEGKDDLNTLLGIRSTLVYSIKMLDALIKEKQVTDKALEDVPAMPDYEEAEKNAGYRLFEDDDEE